MQQKKWNMDASTCTTPFEKSNKEAMDDYNAQILGAPTPNQNMIQKLKGGKALALVLSTAQSQ